jgi:hypothetical protein
MAGAPPPAGAAPPASPHDQSAAFQSDPAAARTAGAPPPALPLVTGTKPRTCSKCSQPCKDHLGRYGPSCTAPPAPESLRAADPGEEPRRPSPEKAAPRAAEPISSPAKPAMSPTKESDSDLWSRRGDPPEGGVWYSAYPGAHPAPPTHPTIPPPFEDPPVDGTCCAACSCPSQAGQWPCHYYPPGTWDSGLEVGDCCCEFHENCLTSGVANYI